jgi:hypothetical protein
MAYREAIQHPRAREVDMAVMEVRFKLEKETKGALRYQEVDEKGEAIEQAWANTNPHIE